MKQTNQEVYRLVGTMNIYGLIPGFTEPIFERDGKYYLQGRTINGSTIESFEEITKEELIKIIHFFTEKDRLINIKTKYNIKDKAVAAFQLNENENFVSDLPTFLKFIKSELTKIIPAQNNNQRKDIEDFTKEVWPTKTEEIMKRFNKK